MTKEPKKELEADQPSDHAGFDIRRFALKTELVSTPDGDLWRSELPDVPGSAAYAAGEADAAHYARANALTVIEHAKRIGMPPPNSEIGDQFTVSVRVMPAVHQQLQMLSDLLHISFNQTVNEVLEDELANHRTGYLSPRTEKHLRLAFGQYDRMVEASLAITTDKSGHWVQRVPKPIHWRLWVHSKHSRQPMSKTLSSTLETGMNRIVDYLRRMKREGFQPTPTVVRIKETPQVPPHKPRSKMRGKHSLG